MHSRLVPPVSNYERRDGVVEYLAAGFCVVVCVYLPRKGVGMDLSREKEPHVVPVRGNNRLVVYGQVETEKCAVGIVIVVIMMSLRLESRVFGVFDPGWRREADRDNSFIVEAFDVLFLRRGELLGDLETCKAHHGHGADRTSLAVECNMQMGIIFVGQSIWKRHSEKGVSGNFFSRIEERHRRARG